MRTTATRREDFLSWLKKQEIIAEELTIHDLQDDSMEAVVSKGKISELLEENPVAIICYVRRHQEHLNRLKGYLDVIGVGLDGARKKSYRQLWLEHEAKRKRELEVKQAWMQWLYEDIA